jgi:hypothetical protein
MRFGTPEEKSHAYKYAPQLTPPTKAKWGLNQSVHVKPASMKLSDT